MDTIATCYRVRILDGSASGEAFTLSRRLTLGRSSASDIQIPHDGVSRQHARIVADGAGRHVLIDLDSTNGTFVEGVSIERYILAVGAVFEIMGTKLVYELDSSVRRGHSGAPRRVDGPSLRPTQEYEHHVTPSPGGARKRELPSLDEADVTAIRRNVGMLGKLSLVRLRYLLQARANGSGQHDTRTVQGEDDESEQCH